MKTFNRLTLILLTLLTINGCQQTSQTKTEEPAQANDQTLWQLDTEKSQINYISTKNGDIQEHNTLRFVSGSIDQQKKVELTIDLNSIDTNIDIRDQRMRDLLFETDQYPTAKIETEIDNNLPLMTAYPIDYRVTLKNQQHSYQSPVMIHSGGGEMMVTSAEPVTVNAETFGLNTALEKLREIAGLSSISPSIQVEYKLHFIQIK
ncbi:MAG: YceI family protein [Proteobacteria bacterium]|nr:YceI family protein [Pseudomonadota bacterium]